MSPVIIHVEGQIATGKSHLVQKLTTILHPSDFLGLPEPSKAWETSGLLEDFYRAPAKYAVALQNFVSSTFLLRDFTARHQEKKLVMLERSFNSSNEVFLPLLRQKNLISTEDELTIRHTNVLYKQRCLQPHLYLFHETDRNKCFPRISERNRPGEREISLNYLRDLEMIQSSWMRSLPHRRVLRISDSPQDIDRLVLRLSILMNQEAAMFHSWEI